MRLECISNTDLAISEIALGTCNFGSAVSEAEAFRIMDAYADAGGRILDTAKIYADWASETKSVSEKTIGKWLRRSGMAREMTVATKGAHPDDGQPKRLDEKSIFTDIEASRENLGLETIPFYWLHRDDPDRSAGEILETMNRAVAEGKIRYFGCSNWHTDRIAEANKHAAENGLSSFAASQILWNVSDIRQEMLWDQTLICMDQPQWQWYAEQGMTVFAYSSQNGGVFSKIAEGKRDLSTLDETNQLTYSRLTELAGAHKSTVTAVVLAYLMCNRVKAVPIIGCSSVQQLQDSLGARVCLTNDEINYIDQVRGWTHE